MDLTRITTIVVIAKTFLVFTIKCLLQTKYMSWNIYLRTYLLAYLRIIGALFMHSRNITCTTAIQVKSSDICIQFNSRTLWIPIKEQERFHFNYESKFEQIAICHADQVFVLVLGRYYSFAYFEYQYFSFLDLKQISVVSEVTSEHGHSPRHCFHPQPQCCQ